MSTCAGRQTEPLWAARAATVEFQKEGGRVRRLLWWLSAYEGRAPLSRACRNTHLQWSRARAAAEVNFIADVRRRLPLLALAVVVFLIVVFLHVYFLWRPWKQQRKRRASTRRAAGERLMAGMEARPAAAAGQGGVRSSTAEPRRRYEPSMYTHLESWDTPLPPSDEEPEKEELSTLPLASGSTQLWSQTVRAGGSAPDEGGEFTSLLHQGLRDDDDGGVDLRFGLCSGGGREASRTFIIDGDHSARGVEHGGSLHMEQSTLRRAAPVTGAVGPSPAGRQHGSNAPYVDRLTPTWPAPPGVAAGPLRMGGARSLMPTCTTLIESGVRDNGTCRAPVRPRPTVDNITRGVSNMRAHSDGGEDDVGFGDDADEGMREDVEAGDDDDDVPIRPLGKTAGRGRGRGRGGVRGRSVGRGGRGGPAEEDNDDDFMMEDDQGEATASAGRESARQRTADQSASKRMSTPPPEAQQLRVRETWKEKGVVVDLGGEDDKPLEKRRLRSATQATTAAVSTARVAEDERPITGALPCTSSQPRQRNDGGDGASRQRGGGGGVVADARAAGGEAAGGAGVAVAGVVPPVPAAREEAAVPATVREEGRGQNTNQRDGGEAASSRARRGVMTKDLIDRALLWVDDKCFWTTGEGRRLYNIVHETKEYFIAFASGLPPLELPRSVFVPKSSTRVARIADQSQLQQAISCAAAVENIVLRILHG
ncbi:hypothetical protein CBR_g50824 [Chara braunii]|uniref:Uncharacterized protein n=1 Tax=Chara braunii TaxID=69332 RepID=A0A388M7B9_CHABU|nr:hypothetical protein CBR_g50824 [Chara braunii]|eukprot:GBG90478.1 hypothetical protein CBR_g50824 [Chara braunii]